MITYKYVAFFDIDRTIIPSDSSTLLIKDAYKKGIIKKKKLLIGYIFSYLYKLRLVKTITIITKIATWLEGLREDLIKEMAANIFKNKLLYTINKEAVKAIEFHKSQGACIVLASSSMNYFCELFAQELVMDHIICTYMEVKNGILTGKPKGEFCFEKNKMLPMIEFCEKNNFNKDTAFFYSDSIDDLPALSNIGIPICINPDKHLEKIAKSRKWEIKLWY